MKIQKLSLFLSLLFLGLFTFQSMTSTDLLENSSTTKIEFKVDERKVKTSIDDSFVFTSSICTVKFSLNHTNHSYKDVIYTFKMSNKLFKPPISI